MGLLMHVAILVIGQCGRRRRRWRRTSMPVDRSGEDMGPTALETTTRAAPASRRQRRKKMTCGQMMMITTTRVRVQVELMMDIRPSNGVPPTVMTRTLKT
jgi:hypothetical protein